MATLLVSNGDNEFVGKLIDSLSTKHGVEVTALIDPRDLEPGSHSHVLVTMPTDAEATMRAKALVDALEIGRASCRERV